MLLLVVLDGLRPDQITQARTPNILRLAAGGVRFASHHSIFPTHTRVNVAGFVTGCYPARHGLVANAFHMSAARPVFRVDTADHLSVLRLEAETGGQALLVSSLGEVLAAAGQRMVTVGVGSSGNALLHNHKAAQTGDPIINPYFSLPQAVAEQVERRFGEWPPAGVPNSARMHRAVSILLDYLVPAYEPAVATLWLSEPDGSQHLAGVGSPQASEGTRAADAQLGRILSYLDSRGLADATDVLVVSDHGQSTVAQTVNIAEELVAAGLKSGLDSDDVSVVDNGGCALVYVRDHDQARAREVATFLMGRPWCGPLFVSAHHESVAGALPLRLVHGQCDRAPDILLSFAWDSAPNQYGVAGRTAHAGYGIEVGGGGHGSISPHEMGCVMVAAGPHFKRGLVSAVPSGNVDIFPTVLHVLGLPLPQQTDGRVLREALVDGPQPDAIEVEMQTHQAAAEFGKHAFRQELLTLKVDEAVYVGAGRVIRS